MKRPLIPVALFYVAGILLAPLRVPLPCLFAAVMLPLALFPFLIRARPWLLCVLLVLAGWINLARRTAVLAPDDLRSQMGNEPAMVVVKGVLRETPSPHLHKLLEPKREYWTSVAELDVTQISLGTEEWKPAHGRILTTTRDRFSTNVFAGQTVQVPGVLRPPTGPVAPGLFDYRDYLAQRGVYYDLAVESPGEWHVLNSPRSPPWPDRFRAWATNALALGLPQVDESLRLEWALTLGWRPALTEDVAEPFIRASTYHIYAVDGLRIAIVSGILFALLRALNIPRTWCGVVALPFLLFYAAMTGWPASAVRAIVMIAVVFAGWVLKRPSDYINSLFMAALVILAWEPRQLYQAGFQLSFFVVLCILLILPFFERIGQWLLRPDPLLPESLRPRWQKIIHPPARWEVDLFLASFAAWLGSIPLVAYYFNIVTPMSGLSNMLAVPLCGLVLICNLASLLFAAWLPAVSMLFNHSGWFLMEAIRRTSEWSANWPAAYYYVRAPGWFGIGLYYAILLTVLTGWLFQSRWRRIKLGSLAGLVAVWCGLWFYERPVTRLTVVPLEAGHAIWLSGPGAAGDWLVDCGNANAADAVLKPFLRAQGVNRLSRFALTHGEAQYSGGATFLFDWFRPRELLISPVPSRSLEYTTFVERMNSNHVPSRHLQAGDRIGPFSVLYPGTDPPFANGEDNGLVLRADINGMRVLLMADPGHAAQNALLNRSADALRADVVVAGMPAQGEPLNDALLDAIQPRVMVVADAEFPAGHKAEAALVERLAHRQVAVIYTRVSRAVTFSFRSTQAWLETMDGVRLDLASLTNAAPPPARPE